MKKYLYNNISHTIKYLALGSLKVELLYCNKLFNGSKFIIPLCD